MEHGGISRAKRVNPVVRLLKLTPELGGGASGDTVGEVEDLRNMLVTWNPDEHAP